MLNPSLTRTSHASLLPALKKNPLENPHGLASPKCGIATLPNCSASLPQRTATVLTAAVTPVLIGPLAFAYFSVKRYQPDARAVNVVRSLAHGNSHRAYRATPSMTRKTALSVGISPPSPAVSAAICPGPS